MKAERLDSALSVDTSDRINPESGDNRAGITEQSKTRGRVTQKVVFLRRGVFQTAGDLHVNRCDRCGAQRKYTEQQRILADQQLCFLVDGVLNLRLQNCADQQAKHRSADRLSEQDNTSRVILINDV